MRAAAPRLTLAEVAQPYFAEASGLARALGDPWRLSQILARQAHMAFVAGHPVELRATAEEGRQLADGIGDRFECGSVGGGSPPHSSWRAIWSERSLS